MGIRDCGICFYTHRDFNAGPRIARFGTHHDRAARSVEGRLAAFCLIALWSRPDQMRRIGFVICSERSPGGSSRDR